MPGVRAQKLNMIAMFRQAVRQKEFGADLMHFFRVLFQISLSPAVNIYS